MLAVRRYSATAARNSSEKIIGFIGLGNMGAHMARNLLRSGHRVLVHDQLSEPVDKLKAEGADVAGSSAEVAAASQRIVTMVPSSPHVREVYTGANGIFSAVQKGSLLIDSSTIDPSVSQEIGKLAREKGADFVDAPVSGGVPAAEKAELTFMVGGSTEAYEEAKKVLESMGKKIFHCGDIGMGEAVKICNNMVLAITMIGTAEAMNLGMRLGLDPKLLADVMNVSTGQSWSSQKYNPVPGVVPGVPASNNYDGGFGAALMLKDLKLGQNAAFETSSSTLMGSVATHVYQILCKQGYSRKDFSSIFHFLQSEK
ncbi:3-hydroxyisobutyrate dehydrogenase, mitochondrial-like [Corticium candelabrum]|uniref:3-hydroxyisobutyrate dehydrogenase, mitochondrial-like n=1 Tax=Corticium candelabrum TaxID=121492 RepID=UPI002E26AE38|nr:3-hydroxyisobutyrate dehydrogenase, mitochondrial-like [Corticium candelabrum]